jgi:hypothetical protein
MQWQFSKLWICTNAMAMTCHSHNAPIAYKIERENKIYFYAMTITPDDWTVTL